MTFPRWLTRVARAVPVFFLFLISGTASSPAPAAWVEHPKAVQTVYQDGVPHTDRHGVRLGRFDPERSFFPIGLYHALHGEVKGRRYDFKDYAAAGFNTCHLWEGQELVDVADAAKAAGIQLIIHHPHDAEVAAHREHPAVLGWYLDEEPTGAHWGRPEKSMDEFFAAYLARRDAIRRIDPRHPVFVLDVPWITAPATEWWTKWNTAGDVACHDNYPVSQARQTLSFDQGIPESVSLAVKVNQGRKPVWLVTQAFEAHDARFPFNMPSSRQLRCMTYTAIVHGATGVVQFALDSWVTRSGGVVGMSPDPQPSYGEHLIATADQLRMSRELWSAAVALNKELHDLRPALLSPTAKVGYRVSLDDTWPAVSPGPIRTLLKQDPRGGFVLIAVNVDAATQRVRVRFPGTRPRAEQMFDAPGAGRLQVDGDAVEFQAGPNGVHVLRLKFIADAAAGAVTP